MRTVDNQVLTALHQIRDAIKNKECCCNKDEQGGGNTPSGDITIDDVVKFIHDDLADTSLASIFPYTTWDEIPNYNSVNKNQICKTTSMSDSMYPCILNSFHHIIGIKYDGLS